MVATDLGVGTESGLQANSITVRAPSGALTASGRGWGAPQDAPLPRIRLESQPMSLMSSMRSVSPVTTNLYSTHASTAPTAGPAM